MTVWKRGSIFLVAVAVAYLATVRNPSSDGCRTCGNVLDPGGTMGSCPTPTGCCEIPARSAMIPEEGSDEEFIVPSADLDDPPAAEVVNADQGRAE